VLLVALEGRPEDYTARLESLIASRRVGVTVLDEDVHDSSLAGDANDASRPHRHDH
jgi:urease accessory protein